MKKIFILFFFTLTAIAILFSCKNNGQTEEQPPEANEKTTVTVKTDSTNNKANEPETYRISIKEFEKAGMKLDTPVVKNSVEKETVTAAGYLMVPKNSKAEVSTYIGGYIQNADFLPGDYVHKGEFLVRLQDIEYIRLQQDYLKAREELKYLKTVYERQSILASEKIASENSLQQAESDYKSAQANVEGLKKMLQLIHIDPEEIEPVTISPTISLYAPIDGYITRANAVKGKFADPAEVIFEIVNTRNIYLELKVYEKDILKIRKGQNVSFVIPEANSEKFSGSVFLVGKTISKEDRTITVFCHISDKSKVPAVIGMYVEAEILTGTEQVLCLPKEAFVRENGRDYVLMKTSFNEKEYVFQKTEVEANWNDQDYKEITDKSKTKLNGKQVLVNGANRIINTN